VLCIHREVTKESRVQSLYENRNNTIDEICKTLNISRATLYRYIQTKEK
jgi:predicted transcriptional regulator YheO